MSLIIIHLPHGERYPPHRLKRYGNLLNELLKQEIHNYIIWPGVIAQQPKVGINKAFKSVVQYAKSLNLPKVIIAEDDICFYGEKKGAWEYYLNNTPEEYDIYVGSYYSGGHGSDYRVSGFRGMTLITVHSRFYDHFLSLPPDMHIDGALAASGAIIKVCPKFVCYQMPGFSDQRKRMCDDGIKHKNKPIYE